MRFNEISSNHNLDEAPSGMLSRLGTKMKTFVPGATGRKAQGKLDAGAEANWLKKKFDTYLGKIGKEPTPQVVINFLKQERYPTGAAEQEMTKVTTGQKMGAAVGTAAAGAAKGVAAVGKGIAKGVGAVAKGVGDAAKGAVAGAQAGVATAKAQQQPAADPNAQGNAQAQQKPQPNAQNTATDNSNIAIKGAKNKKVAQPANKQVVNQSIDWSEATWIFEDANAVLSGGQLDRIFMAAVQQGIERDEGGGTDDGTGVAPDNAQQGGFKGAAQAAGSAVGRAFAEPGAALPPELRKQLEALPGRDKQRLLGMLK